jgi:hypothetical protein
MAGTQTVNIIRSVNITSGPYAGWGYGIVNYDLAGYTGNIYFVRNGQNIWASITGDIHGVSVSTDNGSNIQLHLISINGVQTSGTVDLVTISQTPGITTNYSNFELRVREGMVSEGSAWGYFNGLFQTSGTSIEIPFFQSGISFGVYQSDAGSGNVYRYYDGSSPSSVTVQVSMHGPLFARVDASFAKPVRTGTSISAVWEHVVPISDTTPPTGSITVNSGASYTSSFSVTLSLSCSDTGSGCSEMRFSNDNVTWSAWEAIAVSKAWTLTSGDGLKRVYVQFKDVAGNVSTFSDGIILSTISDLVISSLTAPTTSGAGVTINITETTKNNGPGSAGPSTTKYYLSTNSTLDAGDAYLGSREVPELIAGAINSGSTTVTITGVTAGTYYIIARADDGNVIAEINETNNRRARSIVINP